MISGSNSVQNQPLASVTAKAASIAHYPDTGPLQQLTVRTQTVTTAAAIEVRVETVDQATGYPTGNLVAAGASAVIATPVSNTVYKVTLTTPPNVVRGDLHAIVMQATSGTPNMNLGRWNNARSVASQFPYCAAATTAAYSKATSHLGMHNYYINGSWQVPSGMYPYTDTAATVMTTTSAERGNRFSLPFASRIGGLWVTGPYNVVSSFQLTMYSMSDVILAQTASSGDISKNAAGNSDKPWLLRLATDVELDPDEEARVAIKVLSGTNVTIGSVSVSEAGFLDAMPGGGTVFSTTRPAGGGAWTDNQLRKETIGPIITAINIPPGRSIHDAGSWKAAA